MSCGRRSADAWCAAPTEVDGGRLGGRRRAGDAAWPPVPGAIHSAATALLHSLAIERQSGGAQQLMCISARSRAASAAARVRASSAIHVRVLRAISAQSGLCGPQHNPLRPESGLCASRVLVQAPGGALVPARATPALHTPVATTAPPSLPRHHCPARQPPARQHRRRDGAGAIGILAHCAALAAPARRLIPDNRWRVLSMRVCWSMPGCG